VAERDQAEREARRLRDIRARAAARGGPGRGSGRHPRDDGGARAAAARVEAAEAGRQFAGTLDNT
jgi:hypothetical protein